MDAQAIRLKIIRSCLCENRIKNDKNVELLGCCGFYILTRNRSLLRFYALDEQRAKYLNDELVNSVSYPEHRRHNWDFFLDARGESLDMQLFAVKTTADGNCLLNAISICLFGLEDSELDKSVNVSEASIIRKALKDYMIDNKEHLLLHYRAAEKRFDDSIGVDRSEQELAMDLEEEIERLNDNRKYLAALHVFCMANMLRRPIIVYAHPNPNGNMRGIYLPTMLEPSKTFPCPLTLVWNGDHFTAVLSSECTKMNPTGSDAPSASSSIVVPLFDSHGWLGFPYGWMDEKSKEYKQAAERGFYIVSKLSLEILSTDHTRPSKTVIGPLRKFLHIMTGFGESKAESEGVSDISAYMPIHFASSSIPPTAHRQEAEIDGYIDISPSAGATATASTSTSTAVTALYPYAERLPEHPAREHLLGDRWQEYSTIWVGSFKEQAWRKLSDAVYKFVKRRFSLDANDSKKVLQLLEDMHQLRLQGGLSDSDQRASYSLLMSSGDCSKVRLFADKNRSGTRFGSATHDVDFGFDGDDDGEEEAHAQYRRDTETFSQDLFSENTFEAQPSSSRVGSLSGTKQQEKEHQPPCRAYSMAAGAREDEVDALALYVAIYGEDRREYGTIALGELDDLLKKGFISREYYDRMRATLLDEGNLADVVHLASPDKRQDKSP